MKIDLKNYYIGKVFYKVSRDYSSKNGFKIRKSTIESLTLSSANSDIKFLLLELREDDGSKERRFIKIY